MHRKLPISFQVSQLHCLAPGGGSVALIDYSFLSLFLWHWYCRELHKTVQCLLKLIVSTEDISSSLSYYLLLTHPIKDGCLNAQAWLRCCPGSLIMGWANGHSAGKQICSISEEQQIVCIFSPKGASLRAGLLMPSWAQFQGGGRVSRCWHGRSKCHSKDQKPVLILQVK